MATHSMALWPTLAVLAVATATDLRSRRIPNWLVLPFLGAGIVVSTCLHGWHGLGQSLGGVALATVAFGALFCMGGMGAGDVKLMAAIGAWLGVAQIVTAMVLTGLAGGLIALCWAIGGGFIGELLAGSGNLIFGWKRRGLAPDPDLTLSSPRARAMPYAPVIAIGTLISFLAH